VPKTSPHQDLDSGVHPSPVNVGIVLVFAAFYFRFLNHL